MGKIPMQDKLVKPVASNASVKKKSLVPGIKKGLGRWIPIDFTGTDFSGLHFVDLIKLV